MANPKRLDKLLTDAGLCSRREAKALLRAGRVQVDGRTVRNPEEKYNPGEIELCVDGRVMRIEAHVYYMLHKPLGVICASRSERAKTVVDFIREEDKRPGLFPAGRLDKDSSGFVIVTNDGAFAHRILSPRHKVPKGYIVTLDHRPQMDLISCFERGITLRDGTICKPAKLELLENCKVRVVLWEGRYHQIRRMFASTGYHVEELFRMQIGGLKLDGSLEPGEYRGITAEERSFLEMVESSPVSNN